MLQNDVIKSCLIATSQQRGEIVSRWHFLEILHAKTNMYQIRKLCKI